MRGKPDTSQECPNDHKRVPTIRGRCEKCWDQYPIIDVQEVIALTVSSPDWPIHVGKILRYAT